MNKFILAAAFLWAAATQIATAAGPAHALGQLRLIGLRTIPLKQGFKGTVIGGLSGLDYDPRSDTWVSESDDKSEYSPARFYTLRLDYDENRFTAVEPIAVTLLLQRNGTPYPDLPHAKAHGGEVPDLESVRLDPRDDSIWYVSEGDRPLGLNPFVRHAARDGRYLGELLLPPMFRMHPAEEIGPRHNLAFEGLTFAPDGQTLWVAMEAPLYQDGPVPTPTSGACSRITHYDRAGKIFGQYAYPLDPIPAKPAPGKNADNGVSELLAINDHEFLLIERSGVQDAAGAYLFHIRVYVADFRGATDVHDVASLQGATFQPAKKRLLLDFDRLGQPWVDNLEGVTWGRRLANGHDSVVFVSDDNFEAAQKTQFWVFEVLPASSLPSP